MTRFDLIKDDLQPYSYSVADAIRYAQGKIAYCDHMMAQYESAGRLSEHKCNLGTAFATATVSSPRRFSAVFITSTGSNHELREPAGSAA